MLSPKKVITSWQVRTSCGYFMGAGGVTKPRLIILSGEIKIILSLE